MKKLVITTLVSLSILSFSNASIVVNMQADGLRNDLGALMGSNSLALLVVSTTDAVFSINSIIANSSTAAGTLISSTDDYIAAVIPNTVNARPNPGTLDVSYSNLGAGPLTLSNISGWNVGDRLALVWFPGLPANATIIPSGARYGLFTSAVAGDGIDPWVTPADSGQISIAFGTTDSGYFGGTSSPAAGTTAQTVVPEPATASLGLFGLAALCGFRRRRA